MAADHSHLLEVKFAGWLRLWALAFGTNCLVEHVASTALCFVKRNSLLARSKGRERKRRVASRKRRLLIVRGTWAKKLNAVAKGNGTTRRRNGRWSLEIPRRERLHTRENIAMVSQKRTRNKVETFRQSWNERVPDAIPKHSYSLLFASLSSFTFCVHVYTGEMSLERWVIEYDSSCVAYYDGARLKIVLRELRIFLQNRLE